MKIALCYGIYRGTAHLACKGKHSGMTTTFSREFIAEESILLDSVPPGLAIL